MIDLTIRKGTRSDSAPKALYKRQKIDVLIETIHELCTCCIVFAMESHLVNQGQVRMEKYPSARKRPPIVSAISAGAHLFAYTYIWNLFRGPLYHSRGAHRERRKSHKIGCYSYAGYGYIQPWIHEEHLPDLGLAFLPACSNSWSAVTGKSSYNRLTWTRPWRLQIIIYSSLIACPEAAAPGHPPPSTIPERFSYFEEQSARICILLRKKGIVMECIA